jgi:hypothetical protein
MNWRRQIRAFLALYSLKSIDLTVGICRSRNLAFSGYDLVTATVSLPAGISTASYSSLIRSRPIHPRQEAPASHGCQIPHPVASDNIVIALREIAYGFRAPGNVQSLFLLYKKAEHRPLLVRPKLADNHCGDERRCKFVEEDCSSPAAMAALEVRHTVST